MLTRNPSLVCCANAAQYCTAEVSAAGGGEKNATRKREFSEGDKGTGSLRVCRSPRGYRTLTGALFLADIGIAPARGRRGMLRGPRCWISPFALYSLFYALSPGRGKVRGINWRRFDGGGKELNEKVR